MSLDVDARARALYGQPLQPAHGVVHVVAVAQGAEGRGAEGRGNEYEVIRIGPHAPKSETDFFALSLTRARVGGVLVSGSVLRAEPELRYDLPDALKQWRAAQGLDTPPVVLVLSRGDLPAAHPVWESWARPVVFTSKAAAASLRLPARVEVVGVDDPSPREAVGWLRARAGSVSIEAGPSIAVPLYDPPLVIDELLLSVFEGEIDPRARGRAFLDAAALSDRLRLVSEVRVDEPSGPWRFTRWLR